MGTNWNFKSFTNDSAQPPGNFPLTRQSSIYSLTFDEFQSTVGGIGKDFGSMNMDELLKNIWSAEENQNQNHNMAAAPQDGVLQRQGSLTLPRTLSQKTVDEVWKDVWKDYGNGNGNGSGGGGSGRNNPERQQTLGEITLEEFLVRAGVVREESTPVVSGKVQQPNGGVGGGGGGGGGVSLFGDELRQGNNNNSSGYGIGFQQSNGLGLGSGSNANNHNASVQTASNLGLNVNGGVLRSNQVQTVQHQHQHQHQPPQIFPKQPNVGYGIPQLGGIMGIGEQGISSGNGLIPGGGGMGMVGLGGGSPAASQVSSDGIGKSNGETSSVSPVPYPFSGSVRGRRANTAVEKVVERRQRRMIKNRESAARSRARKQAYTTELEAEVAKLKEENQELKRKQEEITEMQKNQVMEMMNMEQGGKKRRLRRTLTGPW